MRSIGSAITSSARMASVRGTSEVNARSVSPRSRLWQAASTVMSCISRWMSGWSRMNCSYTGGSRYVDTLLRADSRRLLFRFPMASILRTMS